MKILIISKFFYPSVTPRSFRTTALAKAFAKAGHEVQVYTSWNEEIHPAYAVEHGMEIHPLSKGSGKISVQTREQARSDWYGEY